MLVADLGWCLWLLWLLGLWFVGGYYSEQVACACGSVCSLGCCGLFGSDARWVSRLLIVLFVQLCVSD